MPQSQRQRGASVPCAQRGAARQTNADERPAERKKTDERKKKNLFRSNPVALLQLERQVHLAQVLEPETGQRLDLGLGARAHHQLELGHPQRVAAHPVLLELSLLFSVGVFFSFPLAFFSSSSLSGGFGFWFWF